MGECSTYYFFLPYLLLLLSLKEKYLLTYQHTRIHIDYIAFIAKCRFISIKQEESDNANQVNLRGKVGGIGYKCAAKVDLDSVGQGMGEVHPFHRGRNFLPK